MLMLAGNELSGVSFQKKVSRIMQSKKKKEREHSSILTLNIGISLLGENGYVAFWNENPQIAQFQQIPKTLAFLVFI